MLGLRVRRMARSDVAAAAEVAALALADNPTTLGLVGGDRGRAQQMTEAAVRLTKLRRSDTYGLIAEDNDEVVKGVLTAIEWPIANWGRSRS